MYNVVGQSPGGGDGTTTPDSTTNPPNTLPGECGEDRNWVVYVIDTNTGEWKNPCTQEEPPIEGEDMYDVLSDPMHPLTRIYQKTILLFLYKAFLTVLVKYPMRGQPIL
ncbi:MAG: hypothetical protein IPP11_05665 [Chitinophagaceae bacterium]|nr:hypothetical protein [Chitinophagaceae bacterium]